MRVSGQDQELDDPWKSLKLSIFCDSINHEEIQFPLGLLKEFVIPLKTAVTFSDFISAFLLFPPSSEANNGMGGKTACE